MNYWEELLAAYIEAYDMWQNAPSRPKYTKKALRDNARSLAQPILMRMALEFAVRDLDLTVRPKGGGS